jgi:predicted phosphoribosyltransferase
MGNILTNPQYRERRFVFTDRRDAGRQLGEYIRSHLEYRNSVVVAIPAGGIPVGKGVALALGAPFELAVVRKIQIPGNTEAGLVQ